MYVHYSPNQISIRWTICRGFSKLPEDFTRAKVVGMLASCDNKHPVNIDVVKEACGQHLLVTVPAGLPEGVYDILALWTKNHDRSIARSRHNGIFCVTNTPEEATDKGAATTDTILNIKSSTSTYGYDGLSAYELALLKGYTTEDENTWVETQIQVATDTIDEAKTAGVSAVNTATDTAVSVVDSKTTEGLNSLDAAITEATNAISTAKAEAVTAATSDIAEAAEAALGQAQEAYDEAEEDIRTSKQAAIDEVATSGGWTNIIKEGSDSIDLAITDDNGNMLAEMAGGELRVKQFDTRHTAVTEDTGPDLAVADQMGNILAFIHEGRIITRTFDSRQAETESEPMPMILPDTVNSYVGDTLQLFKYPMTLIPAYDDWSVSLSIDTSATSIRKWGRTLRRHSEMKPEATGVYNIHARLIDKHRRIHYAGQFQVNVITPHSPQTMKNILLIGDSETQGIVNNSGITTAQGASESPATNSPFADEVKRLLTATGPAQPAMPAPLGLSNLQLIGTQNTAGGRHEGYGGRDVAWFLSTSSPFYKNGVIDFNAYLAQNTIYPDASHKGADYIYILLGANNTSAVTIEKGKIVRTRTGYTSSLKTLLDTIKSQLIDDSARAYHNPNLKVILLSYAFPFTDGYGYHPNGSGEYTDGLWSAQGYLDLWRQNQAIAADSSYCSFVSSVLIAPQVDSENAYAWINKPKNNYTSDTEVQRIEAIHPNTIGYRMFGAAVVRDIIGRI